MWLAGRSVFARMSRFSAWPEESTRDYAFHSIDTRAGSKKFRPLTAGPTTTLSTT